MTEKEIQKVLGELIEELEQKDKIIDLMSEQLTTPIHNKEWVKEYYEKKTKEGKKNEN